MPIAIVSWINCSEAQQDIKASSFADSVLKFSTGTDIFIDTPKTEFSHISIDGPVQWYP